MTDTTDANVVYSRSSAYMAMLILCLLQSTHHQSRSYETEPQPSRGLGAPLAAPHKFSLLERISLHSTLLRCGRCAQDVRQFREDSTTAHCRTCLHWHAGSADHQRLHQLQAPEERLRLPETGLRTMSAPQCHMPLRRPSLHVRE